MAFEITEKHLIMIGSQPHFLGHLVGKNKLTELHSKWILYIWDTLLHRSLLAHRGSYKTTAIIIIGTIWWLLFHPNDRVGIVRNTFTDAADCVITIRNMFLLDEIKLLFRYAHGFTPKMLVKRNDKVVFNFKKTITPEGSINAYGMDTSITGQHLDKILCDDFVTLEDRVSKAKRDKSKLVIQEIRANIIDPGKQCSFIGTPWHKDDGWTMCPKPIKYDWRRTKLLSDEEIAEKRDVITPSLFAANYDLIHIAAEDALFTNPHYARWDYRVKTGVFGHLDAKYSGDHTNGLTFMAKKKDGRIQAVGFTWPEHVKKKYKFIYNKWKKYMAGTMYLEDNADKGFLADELKEIKTDISELKGMKIPVSTYHEKMNKHVKIETYLYKFWDLIDWDVDTEPEYMNQILDYIEGQEPDDCPDSAASLIREKFHKGSISELYKW